MAGGRGEGGGLGRHALTVAAALGGIGLGAAGMALYGGGADKARVEGIVRDYVLANPEIIPQAIERLQQKDAARAVARHRAALETPWHGAWAGNPQGDVVLVEFFDYACGFCRASNADVDRLLAEDRKLKVVWRELPVLGEGSERAAAASMAAARAGKFKAFHDRLFALGRPDPANISAALAAVGVAAPVGAPEGFAAEVEKNYGLARLVGASGTPTFVVGDTVLQGAVGYDALRQAIAEARARS